MKHAQTFDGEGFGAEQALPGSAPEERGSLSQQLEELRRVAGGTGSAMDFMDAELNAAKAVLKRFVAGEALYQQAVAIQDRLHDQVERMSGNSTRDIYHDGERMTVYDRYWHARFAPGTNLYGPTPAQRESYRIARKLFDDIVTNMDAIERDLDALKAAMDAAGAPWSPGR